METALDQDLELSDQALLVLYCNGDQQAAALLTQRLAPRLFSFCIRLLGDRSEAEDVVQEAMLRLWRMAPDWQQGEAKLSTWVFRVASNLCTDRLRKRGDIGLDQIEEPTDERPDAEVLLMQADRKSALDLALANLPERQRQAVILRHIEGLSNPEIGEILGINVEAVESLTARGKRGLVAALSHKKEELGL
ncbi:MAG: RNA polymerase sigma factor [Litoreibacter sp.]|nr:RNA polymerase sigma factor [Litoreibacter sp.]